MGAGHAHRADRAGTDATVRVGARPRWILLGSLLLAGLATVVGLVALWPDAEQVEQVGEGVTFAAPGVTFPRAVVERAAEPCPVPERDAGGAAGADVADQDCGRMAVTVLEGEADGTRTEVLVPPEVVASGLEAGDEVRVVRVPGDGEESYSYFGTERPRQLWALTVLFVLVVGLVARMRGLLALVGLAFAGWIIATFLLPALLAGESAVLVGLVACSAIMFVVIYTTHGFSVRTSVALLGTLVGIAVTAVIGAVSVTTTWLTGVSDDGGSRLAMLVPGLDFQGLLTCAVMIAGLGVLNDVTITQASAVWELRAASATMSRARLLGSGMRIGRDHIASTIYTIAFAYTGTALTTLLVLELYSLPVLDLLSTEEIAAEVVRTLVTSIGLVLAVPLTTVIAVALVPRGEPAVEPEPEPEPAPA